MDEQRVDRPEPIREDGSMLRTAIKIFLGVLVVLAVLIGGIRLVQNRVAQNANKQANTTPTPTATSSAKSGFPTVSPKDDEQEGNAVTGGGAGVGGGTTKGGLPLVQQQAPQELPNSGPALSLLFLAGAGAAGMLLRRIKS